MVVGRGDFRILGGRSLSGEVKAQGAKNSALPLLAASLLVSGVTVLTNCPNIADVLVMIEILEHLGCEVTRDGDTVAIDASEVRSSEVPKHLMKEMRSSIILLGALLGRTGEGSVTMPGGCAIGLRPIDMHLAALGELSAQTVEIDGRIDCRLKNGRAAEITLPFPSVGATENTIFASVLLSGRTTIKGAAKEPEIVDLQNALNKMGAKVYGAGTDIIYIDGVAALNPTCYNVMPDRIMTGTIMAGAVAAGGDIFIKGAKGDDMHPVSDEFIKMGAEILEQEDGIRFAMRGRPRAVGQVITAPHPSFPTDMGAPFMAAACVAQGVTYLTERVFENRFRHVAPLISMGANIEIDECTAKVIGTNAMYGTKVEAMELRGGAALVVAGLAAGGETVVTGTHFIDRGYEDIVRDFSLLGASIEVEKESRTAK